MRYRAEERLGRVAVVNEAGQTVASFNVCGRAGEMTPEALRELADFAGRLVAMHTPTPEDAHDGR